MSHILVDSNYLSLGKAKKHIGMTYEEVVQIMDIDAYWKDLEAIVEEQKNFYMHHITLRYFF